MKIDFSDKVWLQITFYLLITGLCVSFPHIFTYELGRNMSLVTVMTILILDHYNNLFPLVAAKTTWVKDLVHRYLTLIILSSVTLFAIGALNEKLFDVWPAEHNTLDGAATNAGFIPNGDGALYLLGIQSFLKYGILIQNTLYRPVAHTLNAVLFKISGEDMIYFFYLTTFLLVTATTLLSRVIATLVSPGLEGMALETLVICPRFEGNKVLYQHRKNCLVPEYNPESIAEAIDTSRKMSVIELNMIIAEAARSALKHELSRERTDFLEILNNVRQLWNNRAAFSNEFSK